MKTGIWKAPRTSHNWPIVTHYEMLEVQASRLVRRIKFRLERKGHENGQRILQTAQKRLARRSAMVYKLRHNGSERFTMASGVLFKPRTVTVGKKKCPDGHDVIFSHLETAKPQKHVVKNVFATVQPCGKKFMAVIECDGKDLGKHIKPGALKTVIANVEKYLETLQTFVWNHYTVEIALNLPETATKAPAKRATKPQTAPVLDAADVLADKLRSWADKNGVRIEDILSGETPTTTPEDIVRAVIEDKPLTETAPEVVQVSPETAISPDAETAPQTETVKPAIPTFNEVRDLIAAQADPERGMWLVDDFYDKGTKERLFPTRGQQFVVNGKTYSIHVLPGHHIKGTSMSMGNPSMCVAQHCKDSVKDIRSVAQFKISGTTTRRHYYRALKVIYADAFKDGVETAPQPKPSPAHTLHPSRLIGCTLSTQTAPLPKPRVLPPYCDTAPRTGINRAIVGSNAQYTVLASTHNGAPIWETGEWLRYATPCPKSEAQEIVHAMQRDGFNAKITPCPFHPGAKNQVLAQTGQRRTLETAQMQGELLKTGANRTNQGTVGRKGTLTAQTAAISIGRAPPYQTAL